MNRCSEMEAQRAAPIIVVCRDHTQWLGWLRTSLCPQKE